MVHITPHIFCRQKQNEIGDKQDSTTGECSQRERGGRGYLSDDKPVTMTVVKRSVDKGEGQSKNNSRHEECKPEKDVRQGEPNDLKRGQKGRLKKIKGKYKDQDDEDRRIRMDLFKVYLSDKKEKINVYESKHWLIYIQDISRKKT